MDAAAFGADVVAAVRSFLEQEVDPLLARIDALEKQLAEMPSPKDGEDGKSITAEDVAPLIADEVAKAIAAIPPAKDGKSFDPEEFAEFFKAHTSEQIAIAVAALPPAEKGKDADPVEMERMVADHVERAMAALPVPQDGKSVTLDDIRPLIEESVSKAVSAIPVPKDGIDAMDVMIDREGNLVFTMSDGRLKDVGLVVGRDGLDVDMVEVKAKIDEAVAALPKAKDGMDGVGFDDMSCEIREDGVYLVWEKGDLVKEARLPVPLYRGVFKDGSAYLAGDSVSFGGSTFIAERGTSVKPETPDSGWRLAVKRGRDGKDAPTDPNKGK